MSEVAAPVHRQGKRMRLKRIFAFSPVVLLATVLPGLLLAVLLGWDHRIFGETLQQVGDRFAWIEGICTVVTVMLAYTWFLRPLSKHLVMHVLVVWLLVETIQCAASLLLGASWLDALNWRVMLRELAYALLAVALVALSRVGPQHLVRGGRG
jgi:hypothetical protein